MRRQLHAKPTALRSYPAPNHPLIPPLPQCKPSPKLSLTWGETSQTSQKKPQRPAVSDGMISVIKATNYSILNYSNFAVTIGRHLHMRVIRRRRIPPTRPVQPLSLPPPTKVPCRHHWWVPEWGRLSCAWSTLRHPVWTAWNWHTTLTREW